MAHFFSSISFLDGTHRAKMAFLVARGVTFWVIAVSPYALFHHF